MSVPSAPQIRIRPRPSNGQILFRWTAPLSDGGSPITGYTLSCDGLSDTYLPADGTIYIKTGLTNGTLYTFSLTAENAYGSSPAATYRTVQPGNKPSAPQNVVATIEGADGAIITWDPPASDGGAIVKWYRVTTNSSDPADPIIIKSANGSTVSRFIGGLNTASSYTFKLVAINDPGYSPVALSNSIAWALTGWNLRETPGLRNFIYVGMAANQPNYRIAVDAGDYGTSNNGSVWRSVDGGVTWAVSTSAGSHYFTYCKVSGNGATMVAMYYDSNTTRGAMLSTDYGVTWTDITSAVGFTGIYSAAISANGAIIYIADLNGSGIKVSTNSGASWSTLTFPIYISAIACSDNGAVIAVTEQSGSIHVSTDSGANFTTVSGTSGPWIDIAMSSTGTYMVALPDSYGDYTARYIWTSSNTGTSFTEQTSGPSGFWFTASVSADGGYMFATDTGANSLQVSTDYGSSWSAVSYGYGGGINVAVCDASGADIMAINENYGKYLIYGPISSTSWTRPTTPGYNAWGAMTCSSDFSKIFAIANGNAYKSADSGATWTKVFDTGGAYCIACSSDASIVYIGENGGSSQLWKSTDYGATFSQVVAAPGGAYYTLGCSADGSTFLYGIFGYGVYVSTDGGTNVTQTSLPDNYWQSCTVSADGTKMCIVPYDTIGIKYSTNSGATWNTTSGTTSDYWGAVYGSADGSKLVASSAANPTYWISTNYGASFTSNASPTGFNVGIICSDDFQTMYLADQAGGAGGYIYKSTDSGATFTAITSTPPGTSTSWSAIACSADGAKVAVAIYNGQIWTYT